MSMITKDPLTSLVRLLYALLAVIIIIFVLPKAVSCLLPFLCAWIAALIIKPVVRLMENLRINRRLAVIIAMLLVLGIIFGVLYGVSAAVVKELKTFTDMFADTKEGIPMFIWDIINAFPQGVRAAVTELVKTNFTDIPELIYPAIKTALPKLGGAAGKLPSALVFTVVFLMTVYFLSYDSKGFRTEIKRFIPKDKIDKLRHVRKILGKACGGYIKAQLIIMTVVFAILLTGFIILDVELSFLLALAISILDAIPVLGTGMILNPWAFICLIQGNVSRALGLVCLYGIVLVVRHFIEPKVLSGQLGIHPIITLASMYAGLKLIGVIGMILGPLAALIIINLIKVQNEEA